MTKNIGLFIREMRKQKRLTQKDLALKLGVSNKAVSKWEVGDSYPDISLLTKIADVFKINTDELLNCKTDDKVKKEDCKSKTTKLLFVNLTFNFLLILLNIVFIVILLFASDDSYSSFSITNYREFSFISLIILLMISVVISVYNLLQYNKKGDNNNEKANSI